jgi:hypothetical protein
MAKVDYSIREEAKKLVSQLWQDFLAGGPIEGFEDIRHDMALPKKMAKEFMIFAKSQPKYPYLSLEDNPASELCPDMKNLPRDQKYFSLDYFIDRTIGFVSFPKLAA